MAEEKWAVLHDRPELDHPFLNVTMQTVQLPDGRIIEDWPIVRTPDYVNALVLDESGQAMILDGYKHGLGQSSWQVLGGYLEPDEQPLAAVQRELLEETGYQSQDWKRLGSFVVDANRFVGLGHFYLARNARHVAAPNHDDLEQFAVRWVTQPELKRALADGRVGIISYAVNIALGLLELGS